MQSSASDEEAWKYDLISSRLKGQAGCSDEQEEGKSCGEAPGSKIALNLVGGSYNPTSL